MASKVGQHPREILSNPVITLNNDEYFNKIIGRIEDMLVEDEFLGKQTGFMERYWKDFDDDEENKLVYTDIFKEYQNEIEAYIESYLRRSVEKFSMETFTEELQERRDDLNGEIFEVLFTLTDFMYFKEMILDYKAMKEGRMLDVTGDVVIKKINMASFDRY